MGNKRPRVPRNLLTNGLVWLVVFFSLLGIVRLAAGGMGSDTRNLSQSEFMTQLSAGQIASLKIQPQSGAYTVTGTYRGEGNSASTSTSNGITIFDNTNKSTQFKTHILPNDGTLTKISDEAEKTRTKIDALTEDQTGTWLAVALNILPLIFFFFLMYMMFNQAQGGGRGNPMQMGKSRAKDRSKESKVRFSDVAGEDEEKQELVEVVDFLKAPEKYRRLGARIPKGILLEGPPGTGKTLLAKAVAGEAHVPFYSISGSEFVEMFVGVGASRVRDLFSTAKKNAPSIIFIDEIDAVGRKRGNGISGGHDEREQTLNQLLVELDGFEDEDTVIVIAATNRSDVLDEALLRPGRFDRQILVGRPDVRGREAILKVHARNKPFANDVDLKVIAQNTPGFTGAELENILNEAALLAARLDKPRIEMVDVDEAQDRVIAGPAKPNAQVSSKERRITAFHEAGHAVAGLVLSKARVVHKVTIVPRGRAGGYNLMLPREDQNMYSKEEMFEQVVGLLGGRAAEEVFFNTKTTGASNDFEQATAMVRSMITEYGMTDELGPISYEGSHGMRGTNPYEAKSYSSETSAKVDDVLRKMMDEAMNTARKVLEEHREQVTVIAEKLLEVETLNEKEVKSLFDTGHMPESTEKDAQEEPTPKTFEEAKADLQRRSLERQKEAAHQRVESLNETSQDEVADTDEESNKQEDSTDDE